MRNYTLSGEYEWVNCKIHEELLLQRRKQSWGLRLSECGYRLKVVWAWCDLYMCDEVCVGEMGQCDNNLELGWSWSVNVRRVLWDVKLGPKSTSVLLGWAHSLWDWFISVQLFSEGAVSEVGSDQVIRSSHLSIYILFFHDESLCFILLFWFIIWFVMLFYDRTFWKILMTHWWAITYRSQKCCLVIQDSPMYIRRLSCLRERTIKFRIYS